MLMNSIGRRHSDRERRKLCTVNENAFNGLLENAKDQVIGNNIKTGTCATADRLIRWNATFNKDKFNEVDDEVRI